MFVCIFFEVLRIYYRPALRSKAGKVMFSQVFVCSHGGVCLLVCLLREEGVLPPGVTYPLTRHTLLTKHTSPLTRHTTPQPPPQPDTPPLTPTHPPYTEIPSSAGRYASYWNAFLFHYRLQMKLREGNVFTHIYQSFCPKGGFYPSMYHWSHDQPLHSPDRRQNPSSQPGGRHPQVNPSPTQEGDAPSHGQQAGGTHATGMHPCCIYFFHFKDQIFMTLWRLLTITLKCIAAKWIHCHRTSS